MIREVMCYLTVRDAKSAIEFYRKAFGAEEVCRLVDPGDGRVGHAELRFGPRVVMLSDEYPDYNALGPQSLGGVTSALYLQVDNVDRFVEQARTAGATMVKPPTDEFYGERSARLRDPFGQEWMIGHEVEKVSPQEMQRRWNAASARQS